MSIQEELLGRVSSHGRRVNRLFPIWDIRTIPRWPFGRKARVAARTAEGILTTLLTGEGPLFLRTSESPPDWEIPGEWNEVLPNTWRVPVGTTTEDLKPLLEIGSWSLYATPAPPPEVGPDPWRRGNEEALMGFLSGHHVSVFVTSYADDRDWRIVLAGCSEHPPWRRDGPTPR